MKYVSIWYLQIIIFVYIYILLKVIQTLFGLNFFQKNINLKLWDGGSSTKNQTNDVLFHFTFREINKDREVAAPMIDPLNYLPTQ
jgi:multisubunit Na+/H+ antiporter MnhC subunit